MATPNNFNNVGSTGMIPTKQYSSLQPVNIQQNAQKNAQSLSSSNNGTGLGSSIYNGMVGLGNGIINAFSGNKTTPTSSYSSPTYTAPTGYQSPKSLSYSPTNPLSTNTTTPKTGNVTGILHPTVSTPVKKQTTTNADGTSHTTEYTAPVDTTKTAGVNTSGSNLTAGQIAQNNQTPTTPTSTTQPTQTTPTLSSAATNLSNTAAGNSAIGQSAADITAEANKEYNQIGQQGANSELGYSSGQLSPIGQGNAQAIANTTAQKQQAVAQGAQLALTGTGQQLTAQNQAANAYNQVGGLVNPTQVTPGTALVNPTNGQEQYSGIGGLVGLAKANQSINQAQDSGTQAYEMGINLNTLKQTGDTTVNLLKNSGLSLTDNAATNQAIIENWGKQKNPQAYSSYMSAAGDLENTISGIIAGYTGQTPTAVTSTLDSMNFKYLSPTQLQGFLQNVDTIGNIRYNQLQQQSNTSYNAAQNKQSYTGAPATTDTSLQAGTPISNQNAALGVGADIANTLESSGKGVAALAGGLFEKVFGAK